MLRALLTLISLLGSVSVPVYRDILFTGIKRKELEYG
jgi:hypothetical protein